MATNYFSNHYTSQSGVATTADSTRVNVPADINGSSVRYIRGECQWPATVATGNIFRMFRAYSSWRIHELYLSVDISTAPTALALGVGVYGIAGSQIYETTGAQVLWNFSSLADASGDIAREDVFPNYKLGATGVGNFPDARGWKLWEQIDAAKVSGYDYSEDPRIWFDVCITTGTVTDPQAGTAILEMYYTSNA